MKRSNSIFTFVLILLSVIILMGATSVSSRAGLLL